MNSRETLARLTELRGALDKWRAIDVSAAAARARAYLPAEIAIRATIYPVIKGTSNSFVFELGTNPAVFLAAIASPR